MVNSRDLNVCVWDFFFSLCGDVCSLSYYCEHARQNYIQSKLILVGGILVHFSQLTFLWLFRAGKIVHFRIYIYFFGNEMYIKNKQNDWTVLVLFQWAKKTEKIWNLNFSEIKLLVDVLSSLKFILNTPHLNNWWVYQQTVLSAFTVQYQCFSSSL